MDLSKTEQIVCPLCNHNSSIPKYKIGFWNIVQCRYCRLVYVNPRLKKPELYKLYTSNYFDNRLIGYYHYTESKDLRKRNFQKWVQDALPYLKKHHTVKALDVGCAAGYCLEVFQQYGWQPYGVELDKKLAEELRKNGFSIFDEPLLRLRSPHRYALITLFDVIEHLTDLHENMAKLHALLEPEGIVVLVTPDYQNWQRKFFGKRWFQFKPLEHIHYFSLVTFKRLAAAHGFQIVATKKPGQFCNTLFLENRLRKYGFGKLLPIFRMASTLFRLSGKYLYVDTASLYIVLKKMAVEKEAAPEPLHSKQQKRA